MDRRTDLLKRLIATPSQVTVNDPGPVLDCLCDWLTHNDVEYVLVGPSSRPLAVVINPPSDDESEVLLLDACLDTAPVGDLDQWTLPPFSGDVRDGWLYGRGSADSKAAVAVFSELATRVHLSQGVPFSPKRHVTILFDCDEHSGRFGGIRAYTAQYGYPKYCVIGYPGIDEIVAGSRGFYRTTATLRGTLAHAGAGTVPEELATNKLAALLVALRDLPESKVQSDDFPLPPRASVTWIRTGVKSYSITPAKIDCAIDIRLTPSFGPVEAKAFLERTLQEIDRSEGSRLHSKLSRPSFWPAYRTPDRALLPSLLQASATRYLKIRPPLRVSGPSNIGNYLAMHGTEMLSGFGVDYRHIHGPDECIRVESVETVSNVYADLIARFLSARASDA